MRLLGDLARDAGGALQVESEPDRGTRVTIEVPR
jgi:signal transduction histidine kinase